MKKNLLLILFFLPVVAFSQYSTIKGIIISADSIPLHGAYVIVIGTPLGTTSDDKGSYVLGRITPGALKVRVSLLGYETVEKSVNLKPGVTGVNFILDESEINTGEVVVTATRSEKMLKNVPVVTQVISTRKMLDLGIDNVPEALQNMVPGLDVSQYGQRTSVTLQGLDSKYVLFLIDGERIAGEVNGDIDYSMLSMENIDHIEVIKGASSSLYGSNAIGGVVNLITKDIPESFDARIYTRYSRYNELYSGAGVSFRKGILGSRTSFSFNHTNGYDVTPETSYDWTQNPYNSFTINQKFEIMPSPRLSFSPIINYYRFERGNVSARPAHDLYRDLNSGFKGRYFFGEHTLDFSYNLNHYTTYSVLEMLNNRKEMISCDVLQAARVQATFNTSGANTLTAGAEYNGEDLVTARIDGNRKNSEEEVIFLQDDLHQGEVWGLIAGARGSYHSSYGFHAAPKLSLILKNGPLTLRTSAGTGFRSPSLKELYMNFDHFGEWYIIGNKNLKPERSNYLSQSAEFSKSWNNSSLTVYRNSIRNMITDRWLPDTVQLTRQYQNIASGTIFGIDVMTKQKILKGLWLTAGYSYVHSRDNVTELQLYGTTKHSCNFSADYSLKKNDHSMTVQLYCKLSGEKFYEVTDGVTSRDKPYSNWRFTITRQYKWLRLTGGVDNIFALVIPGNIDFISPGRRFFAGINFNPGK